MDTQFVCLSVPWYATHKIAPAVVEVTSEGKAKVLERCKEPAVLKFFNVRFDPANVAFVNMLVTAEWWAAKKGLEFNPDVTASQGGNGVWQLDDLYPRAEEILRQQGREARRRGTKVTACVPPAFLEGYREAGQKLAA